MRMPRDEQVFRLHPPDQPAQLAFGRRDRPGHGFRLPPADGQPLAGRPLTYLIFLAGAGLLRRAHPDVRVDIIVFNCFRPQIKKTPKTRLNPQSAQESQINPPNYYILPDCWESGVDWTFTVVDGEIVWPATFDTGYLLDADYGNVWIKSGDSFVEDGTLYLIVDSYYLPDYYNYDLDSAYESFTLPEGVTL